VALLGKRETFPNWEDGKVTLFSIEVNQSGRAKKQVHWVTVAEIQGCCGRAGERE